MSEHNIILSLDAPLICTWLEAFKVFEPLHQGHKADIERLHDIFASSMPAPTWTVAVPGKVFDERNPKPGDNLAVVWNPLALIAWVKETSAKRGFPYNDRQSANLINGVEDYGF